MAEKPERGADPGAESSPAAEAGPAVTAKQAPERVAEPVTDNPVAQAGGDKPLGAARSQTHASSSGAKTAPRAKAATPTKPAPDAAGGKPVDKPQASAVAKDKEEHADEQANVKDGVPLRDRVEPTVGAGAAAAQATGGFQVSGRLVVAFVAGVVVALLILQSVAAMQAQSHSQQTAAEALNTVAQALKAMEQHAAAAPPGPAPAAIKSPEDSTEDYAYYAERANAAFEAGNYRGAAAEYEKAVAASPNMKVGDEAYFRLGLCCLRLGLNKRAQEALRTVIEEYRGSAYVGPALFELAADLMREQRYAQARQLLYRLLALRNALGPDAPPYLQRTPYTIARCYEAEANVLRRAATAEPPKTAVAPAGPATSAIVAVAAKSVKAEE